MTAVNQIQERSGSPSKMAKSRDRMSPILLSSSDAGKDRYRWDSAATSSNVFKHPQQSTHSNKENVPPLLQSSRGREEAKPSGKMSFLRSLSPERRGNKPVKSCSVSPFKQDKSKRMEAEVVNGSTRAGSSDRSQIEINEEFSSMLGEMEVPTTLRLKLMSLEANVKESMMKGQASLSLGALSAASSGKSRMAIPESHRKSKESGTITVDECFSSLETLAPPDRNAILGGSQGRIPSIGSESSKQHYKNSLSRSPEMISSSSFLTAPRPRSRSRSASSSSIITSNGGSTSASSFATLLKTADTSLLDVSRIKKMRVILSSEGVGWIEKFVQEGGYLAMATRLKELVNMEWREEQHDDQLLHELLRCFVALSTTEIGRLTLQSMMPTPFVELSDLLFSEKRPGDLSTRRLLVDLLTLLVDLPMSCTSTELAFVTEARETSSISYALQSQQPNNFLLLFTLLHNLRDPIQEAKVDFIKASHASRPFKMLISELLNLNRDYFWIFCHSNRFWSLEEVNVDQVECPKVPGGMTGGVEYEAMAYLTALMKMINAVSARLLDLSRSFNDARIARDFHDLLFTSGMERTLITTRKASQVYYQPLHLELARYFDLARKSRFAVPLELEVWQSAPRLTTTEYRYFEGRQGHQSQAILPLEGKALPQPQSAIKGDDSKTPINKCDTGRWLGHAKAPKRADVGCHAAVSRAAAGNVQSRASQVGDAVQRWEQMSSKR